MSGRRYKPQPKIGSFLGERKGPEGGLPLSGGAPGAASDASYALVEPLEGSLFGRESGVRLARVRGSALAALDVCDGDHVLLARRAHAEHGDLAALPIRVVRRADGSLLAPGTAETALSLWKVYPEMNRLRLSVGVHDPANAFSAPVDVPIAGVVVAVVRKMP